MYLKLTTNSSSRYGDNIDIALKIANRGIPTFPADPLTKRPMVADWPNVATTDNRAIEKLWRRFPDAVPAIVTGARSGLAVIDLDRGHGDERDGITALEGLGLKVRDVSHVRIRTPSGGQHIYVAWEDGITNAASHLPHGIDIRGEGGYVIAPGAIMADGRSYRYTSRDTLENDVIGLPPMPPALCAPEREERQSANDNALELSRHDVKAVVREYCEAHDLEHREPWLKLGMALHDWSDNDGDGFDIWHQASKQTEFYRREPKQAFKELRDQWKSFDREYQGEPITMASLICDAPNWNYERRLRECIADFDEDDGQEALIKEDEAAVAARARSLVMLTPDDCDIGSHNPYVIKGLCGSGDTMTIVGAPGVGKSALAARLAYAVAQGETVQGMRTRQGKVFYIACENETDMKRRVKALRDRHGPAADFHLVLNGGGNLKKGNPYLRTLLEEIKRQRPALVVIDTFAAAMPGFEENSSEGMGQAIAVAKSLGRYGAAVIIVHHDTKAGDGLPRGHSSLNGIVDVNLALRRNEDGIITGECSKNRSGKSHEQIIAYENQVVELGIDQDGDAITTVICDEFVGDRWHDVPPISGNPAKAFEILQSIAGDRSTVALDTWRAAAMDSDWLASLDKPDTRRKTFRRAREELEKRGWIKVTEKGVRLTDPSRTCLSPEDFDNEPPRNREDLS